jgi:hypothetical protein
LADEGCDTKTDFAFARQYGEAPSFQNRNQPGFPTKKTKVLNILEI